jgi:hypothetical protein
MSALLIFSWILLVASITFALTSISAMVQSLLTPEHDWSRGKGQLAASRSKKCFVLGLATFLGFALLLLWSPRENETSPRAGKKTTVIHPSVCLPISPPAVDSARGKGRESSGSTGSKTSPVPKPSAVPQKKPRRLDTVRIVDTVRVCPK